MNGMKSQFFVTDGMFRNVLCTVYSRATADESNQVSLELTEDELYALGYVGGWLIRSEVDKII